MKRNITMCGTDPFQVETKTGAVSAGAPKQKLEFAYDYQWRRIQKKVSDWSGSSYTATYTNRFAYDKWNLLIVFNSSSLAKSFLWGKDLSGSPQSAGGVGGLVAVMDVIANITQFAAYDGIGNVVALANSNDGSQDVVYDYGPFGESIRTLGDMMGGNPFKFSTKYCDQETAHVYYGYRYFAPQLGRWLGRDPLGERGGDNLYSFVDNTPTIYIDYQGLIKKCLRVLVLGHGSKQGFPAVNDFLDGGVSTGCDASKISLVTCGANYFYDSIPDENKLEIPEEIFNGSDEVPTKQELDYLKKLKDKYPNLKDWPDPNADNYKISYTSTKIDMAAYEYVVGQIKLDCKKSNNCCSAIKLVVICDKATSEGFDRHIANHPDFKGKKNPCNKGYAFSCK